MTQHDNDDDKGNDTEQIGRRLLSAQHPAERDEARKIFQRLLNGEDPADLRDKIDALARRTVRRMEVERRESWRR